MHNYKPLTLRAPPLREMFFCEFRTRRCDGFPIVTSRFGRSLSSSQRVQNTNKHIRKVSENSAAPKALLSIVPFGTNKNKSSEVVVAVVVVVAGDFCYHCREKTNRMLIDCALASF